MHSDLIYQIAITLVPDIGHISGKKLIQHIGSINGVFNESRKNLLLIPGISRRMVDSIINQKVLSQAEKEIKFIEKNNIKPLFFMDQAYPNRLKHCVDGPIMLYFKGDTNLNVSKVVSIVGTRTPSEHGKSQCQKLIQELASTDVLVISGLAYGIDVCSHRAAMDYGLKTVGVLGHGLDRLYPAQNRKTADKMLENGGLLTEFLPGTLPDRTNFPMRNRIVAGMSDATIVVESKASGGSLITAKLAFDYNRDVMAIPGRPDDELSRGCNNLIKNNIAQLINNGKDFMRMLNWEEQAIKERQVQKALFVDFTKDEQQIIEVIMDSKAHSIDEISLSSKTTISKTAALLLGLEFKGVIKSLPGKLYRIA
ncbi:MAG: DNA-protecting protein DprA [Bacteroidetes bacterium]|nr:MAG: DNA-protecting protein DprA [Bacteroidota bacterium]